MTYDGTVRDSRGDIVQFRYGSDGLDPCEMEVEGFPADLNLELANIKVSIESFERHHVPYNAFVFFLPGHLPLPI